MKELESALKFFSTMQISQGLSEIYSQLPKGTCSGSAVCCSESVNCFYSEYLSIVTELDQKNILNRFAKAATYYYLTELTAGGSCPFLDERKMCVVYESRPLPCRIFGFLSKLDYSKNYDAVLMQSKEAIHELKSDFGIEVPKSVYEKEIPFCENFCADNLLSLDDRDDFIDKLFYLESKFLMEGLLEGDEINLSLTQWFAYTYLGVERANDLRVKIAQEFTRYGKSSSLNSLNLLDK
jgi:Fe-S-cluster containining protein